MMVIIKFYKTFLDAMFGYNYFRTSTPAFDSAILTTILYLWMLPGCCIYFNINVIVLVLFLLFIFIIYYIIYTRPFVDYLVSDGDKKKGYLIIILKIIIGLIGYVIALN